MNKVTREGNTIKIEFDPPPITTITETWIHADVCPFIVEVKCGECGLKVAELARVRQVGKTEPEIHAFCRECADSTPRLNGKVTDIGWMADGVLVKATYDPA